MKFMPIIVPVLISVVLFFAFSRSHAKRKQDDIYAQLKALPKVAKDFSTPEGAILCLEDAYREHDIKAAIAAKDFYLEAKLMLADTGFKDIAEESQITKLAEALKLGYEREITNAWPDFSKLESFFTKQEPYAENVVQVTEACRFPDGKFSIQKLLVAKTSTGWRVLNPVTK